MEQVRPRGEAAAWLYAALGASALAVLPLMVHNRLHVEVASRSFAALVAMAVACVAIRICTIAPRSHWQTRLHHFAEFALVLVLMGTLGAIASYAAAAETSGFSDAALARSDALLHFDWVALYGMVIRHPALQLAGTLAYGSIYLTPWLILGWFAWHRETARAHRFLLGFWLASVLTLCLFPLFPARGALQYLWHGPIAYMPTSGLYQGTIIPALRAHTIHAIDLGAVRGIVCAPSFHTACAVLYMTAAWPFAALRRIVVPVNLAMLLSTPIEGTHYLTDMLLGAAVAGAAIVTVRWLAASMTATPAGEIRQS